MRARAIAAMWVCWGLLGGLPAAAQAQIRVTPASNVERSGGGGAGLTEDLLFDYRSLDEAKRALGAVVVDGMRAIGITYVPQSRMFRSRDFVFVPLYIVAFPNGRIDVIASKEDLVDGQPERSMASTDDIMVLRVRGPAGQQFTPTTINTGAHRCPFFNIGLEVKKITAQAYTLVAGCSGMNRGEMFSSETEITLNDFGVQRVIDAAAARAEERSAWKPTLDGVFAVSNENPAVVLLTTCDVLDGVEPSVWIGVADKQAPELLRQLMGNPGAGLTLRVVTAGKAGAQAFTANQAGSDEAGGLLLTINDLEVPVSIMGGPVRKADVQQLIRASAIALEVKGMRFTFPATGSARAIGGLSCSK